MWMGAEEAYHGSTYRLATDAARVPHDLNMRDHALRHFFTLRPPHSIISRRLGAPRYQGTRRIRRQGFWPHHRWCDWTDSVENVIAKVGQKSCCNGSQKRACEQRQPQSPKASCLDPHVKRKQPACCRSLLVRNIDTTQQ